MSPLSKVWLNGFLQRIVNRCLFYSAQALIDMAECTIMCISIIMGINLVCNEYGIVMWRKNHFWDFLLTTTFADKDNSSSDALLSDNLSKSQQNFVEGRHVYFWWLIGVSTLHVRAQAPNLTIKTLILNGMHVMWWALSKPWWWGVDMA